MPSPLHRENKSARGEGERKAWRLLSLVDTPDDFLAVAAGSHAGAFPVFIPG
jgi:hypothetical protein